MVKLASESPEFDSIDNDILKHTYDVIKNL